MTLRTVAERKSNRRTTTDRIGRWTVVPQASPDGPDQSHHADSREWRGRTRDGVSRGWRQIRPQRDLVQSPTSIAASTEARHVTERLFVYGTLAPGRPNEHVLAGVTGEWQPATVRGELRQEGWGAAIGFAGIVLEERGPEVHGMLFSSEGLRDHWRRLDDFEGDGYERVLSTVTLQDGGTALAYIYVLRGLSVALETGPSA